MASKRTWAEMEAASLATEEGRAFAAIGFEVWMSGGGCTAWFKQLPADKYMLITDSSGSDHHLNADGYDGKPDYWIVGIHFDGSDGEYLESATHDEAVAAALAILFRESIRRDVPDNVAEIDAINAARADATCATHDFCDSNMNMLEAWRACYGPDAFLDADNQAYADLWNRAWDIAKADGFAVKGAAGK